MLVCFNAVPDCLSVPPCDCNLIGRLNNEGSTLHQVSKTKITD